MLGGSASKKKGPAVEEKEKEAPKVPERKGRESKRPAKDKPEVSFDLDKMPKPMEDAELKKKLTLLGNQNNTLKKFAETLRIEMQKMQE